MTLQCVAGAMYITGFSESVAELLGLQTQWAVRGMSVAILLALLGINLAGVKWIVRLQLLLLAVLAVSTLDFVIGTFTHLDPGRAWVMNTDSQYCYNQPGFINGQKYVNKKIKIKKTYTRYSITQRKDPNPWFKMCLNMIIMHL